MRYLAVGDIHGCYTALKTLAEYAAFQPNDKVITLGDYVDRGPNSYAVLDWLIDYQRRNKLVALRGNHEIMMLRARENPEAISEWIASGGDATLDSYSHFGDRGSLADVPEEHWKFLEQTTRFFAGPRHFYVHANVHPNMELNEQPDFLLFWQPLGDPQPHCRARQWYAGTRRRSQECRYPWDMPSVSTLGHAERVG